MLSDANREIRAQIDEVLERRLHRPPHLVAFDYLDELIGELEELHMRDRHILPPAFDESLKILDNLLPEGIKRPRRWPMKIRDALDTCFELQEQVLRARARCASAHSR